MSSDGTGLTTISGSHPMISRWRLDGVGLGRRLIAPDHMVVGPYSYEGSSVMIAPQAVVSGTPQVWEGVAVQDTSSGEVTYRFDEPVSDVRWAGDRRLIARYAEDEFRLVDAESGEQVGKSILNIYQFWPSLDGERLDAVRVDGRIQGFDPQTGLSVSDSWRVDGWPVWISVAPSGDRMAVTHVDTETTRVDPGRDDEPATGDPIGDRRDPG